MLKWSKFSESLLVRSVYLITIPIVLVQIIGIIIFFELHWDLVLKRSAQSISNEIKILENYQSTVNYASSIASSLKEYDNIICIGSGSVIDLCKFISNQNN